MWKIKPFMDRYDLKDVGFQNQLAEEKVGEGLHRLTLISGVK